MAVAEAENRYTKFKYTGVDLGRIVCIDAGGAAGKNNGAWLQSCNFCCIFIAGYDLGINAQIANAAGDELTVLGAKVQNDNLLIRRGCWHVFLLLDSMFFNFEILPKQKRGNVMFPKN